MKQAKRKFDASFKAKVAIEAIKENETLSSLAAKYEISPIMICRWKKEFLANASAAFETPKNDESAFDKERDRLLRKIGELEIERDSVVRASQKLGIPVPAKK